jgi:hypothetical protein
MPSNLTLSLTLQGEGVIYGTAGLGTPRNTVPIGSGSWAPMTLALTYGAAADNKVKQWYQAQRTVAAGADDPLDLAGSLTNELGESVVLTSVKVLLIAIVAPDGIKQLRVGPQGLAQAFQGPWGGVTATDFTNVDNWCTVINNPWSGYPIVAGATDKIQVHNPSAVSVTYNVLAVGQTA